jgi:hypothetical protein
VPDELEGVATFFIGRQELMKKKRAAGGPQDLAYARKLEMNNWFYDVYGVLAYYPATLFGIAFAFAAGAAGTWWIYRGRRRRAAAAPLAIVAAVWTVEALIEFDAYRHHYNIRFDVFITWPFVAIVTVAGLIFWSVAVRS